MRTRICVILNFYGYCHSNKCERKFFEMWKNFFESSAFFYFFILAYYFRLFYRINVVFVLFTCVLTVSQRYSYV